MLKRSPQDQHSVSIQEDPTLDPHAGSTPHLSFLARAHTPPPAMPSDHLKVIRVRSFKPADLPIAIQLLVDGVRQYPENQPEPTPEWQTLIDVALTGDMTDVEGHYFKIGGHYWVATCARDDGGEDVVGSIALLPGPGKSDALLCRMFVDPAYRRCGIGRKLMDTFEAFAREKGFTRAWLMTGLNAAAAHRLYEACGYEKFETKMLDYGLMVHAYEKQL